MKALWYRWHGHHTQSPDDRRQGIHKARHNSAVHLKMWQQQVQIKRLAPLPYLGTRRINQLKFWASWFNRWHTLISNGFDMTQSLQQLHLQSSCQEEAELSKVALETLYKGQPITAAFKRSPVPIAPRYIQFMEFAEQAGQFEYTLAQLSNTTGHLLKNFLQLRQAMLYPAAVLAMVFMLGAALKFFILPKFAALYAETNAVLPALTQFLLTPTNAVSSSVLVALLFILLGIVLLAQLWGPILLENPSLRSRLSAQPSWHKYIELRYIQQDLHALALGLQHGMTLQQGILSVALTHTSPWRQQLWLHSLRLLHAGKSSEQIFKGHRLSNTEYALIQLGEKSGTLEQKLMQVASGQKQAIEQRLNNMLKLLPNVILIVVSILTGAVMIALYLPLFQLGLAVG